MKKTTKNKTETKKDAKVDLNDKFSSWKKKKEPEQETSTAQDEVQVSQKEESAKKEQTPQQEQKKRTSFFSLFTRKPKTVRTDSSSASEKQSSNQSASSAKKSPEDTEKQEKAIPQESIQSAPQEVKKSKWSFFKRKAKTPAKTAPVQKKAPSVKKKKRETLTSSQRRRNLDAYLSMAGYQDASAEHVRKRVKFISFNLAFLAWIVPLVFALVNGKFLAIAFTWTLASLFVFLPLIWLFIWGFLYFFLELRMYKRTRELEEVLPDFLQLTSANISAGMPIDRALWLAIRPNFGVLAKEIEDVAKATISGKDLKESLTDLTKKYDSTLLKRSISILLEGLEAGGELADLLNKIALNIQELKIMKKEMAANVTTYAIFISFASVAVAPVLFALATQLIDIILSITGSLDLSDSSSSVLSLQTDVSGDLIGNFKIYSYLMMAITGGMSAAIISVIRRGNVVDGIRNIPIYIGVAIAIYVVAAGFFSTLFGNFF